MALHARGILPSLSHEAFHSLAQSSTAENRRASRWYPKPLPFGIGLGFDSSPQLGLGHAVLVGRTLRVFGSRVFSHK